MKNENFALYVYYSLLFRDRRKQIKSLWNFGSPEKFCWPRPHKRKMEQWQLYEIVQTIFMVRQVK